jgi:hypothetical protein
MKLYKSDLYILCIHVCIRVDTMYGIVQSFFSLIKPLSKKGWSGLSPNPLASGVVTLAATGFPVTMVSMCRTIWLI